MTVMTRPQVRRVYFVRRADGEGPVKIGCSESPETRLSTFATWAPYPLAIVATIIGGEDLERRFHARFAAQHSHREWFHPSPELTLMLAEIQAGTFDPATLPGPKCVTHSSRTRPPISKDVRDGMSWTHRIHWLQKRGVEIPKEVSVAAFRWGAGRYFHDYDPHNPRDRATVEAFLAGHPRVADQRRAGSRRAA